MTHLYITDESYSEFHLGGIFKCDDDMVRYSHGMSLKMQELSQILAKAEGNRLIHKSPDKIEDLLRIGFDMGGKFLRIMKSMNSST